MLHTELKLSTLKKEDYDHAAKILALSCLRGAIEDQEINISFETLEALERYCWHDIITYYTQYSLENAELNPVTFYTGELTGPEYHDELLIDSKDEELFETIVDLALSKIKDLAKAQYASEAA